MLAKKNTHIWLAFVGIVVGFTIMNLVVAHNNDPTKLAILIAGALLCVLSPLAALLWSLKRKARLARSRCEPEAQNAVLLETSTSAQPHENQETTAPNPYDPPRHSA